MSVVRQGVGREQRGVGMVEVLVALLVIAVGVLGYAGMQLFALRGAEDAGSRTHATLIARDALERLLINPAGGGTYFGADSWPAAPVAPGAAYPSLCGSADCAPAGLASADIEQLSWMAANTLPLGMIMARDDCSGVPSASCVVVSWQGVTPADCIAGGQIPARDSCVVLEALRP
ncbi:MAG: type IV pilus modification protein PilV [Alcanivoracaceae bacterium]